MLGSRDTLELSLEKTEARSKAVGIEADWAVRLLKDALRVGADELDDDAVDHTIACLARYGERQRHAVQKAAGR
jgi:hypothetical protein